MRLFEAIIDANHRAIAGDTRAGLHPAEHEADLPVVALTCIDARLNPLLPEVLGIPEEKFIWLRNAGNIVTGPLSSIMRSLALACAIKGGKEIVVIGHTDCLVGKTSVMALTDRFRDLGIDRQRLPDNLSEFFGIFASERQNVIKAADFIRHSPLIGPTVPVHGLLVDIRDGNLEWLVNGYETLGRPHAPGIALPKPINQTLETINHALDTGIGGLTSVEMKIGELTTKVDQWLTKAEAALAPAGDQEQQKSSAQHPTTPPKIGTPPRLALRPVLRRKN